MMVREILDDRLRADLAAVAECCVRTPNDLRMRALERSEVEGLQTPAYVFDPAVVMQRYTALRSALGTRLIVSLKANSLVDLLMRCAPAFTDGIELASLGELAAVNGRVAAPKYVNNPSMDDEFMRAAAVSGCSFVVDSLQQARRLGALANGPRVLAASLRLNVPACLDAGVRGDHFGMDLDDAIAAGRLLSEAGVVVDGVHAFNGSNTFGREGQRHLEAVAQLVPHIETGLQARLQAINLGGGFGDDWDEDPAALVTYREHLSRHFGKSYKLAHESGRGLFAHAGAFVTRVVATKRLGDRDVAVCDGGMAQNFLLAMTEGLLRKHKAPHLLAMAGPVADLDPPRAVQYVGSSCSRQDVIGFDAAAPRTPHVGDACVFYGCGAYNSTYTMSRFLALPAASAYVRSPA